MGSRWEPVGPTSSCSNDQSAVLVDPVEAVRAPAELLRISLAIVVRELDSGDVGCAEEVLEALNRTLVQRLIVFDAVSGPVAKDDIPRGVSGRDVEEEVARLRDRPW